MVVVLLYMKEMVGHTDCSELAELEDKELVVVDEDCELEELCGGAKVTKEGDGDLEAGGEMEREVLVRLVLTDEEVLGVEPLESPEVPRADPRGI